MADATLYLSSDAEATLRSVHGKRACDDGRALLSDAAREAARYQLWDCDVDDDATVSRLASKFKQLGRRDPDRLVDADEFVRLVRQGAPPAAAAAAPRDGGESEPARARNASAFSTYRSALAAITASLDRTWRDTLPDVFRRGREPAAAAAARAPRAARAAAATALGAEALAPRGWEQRAARRDAHVEARLARKRKALADEAEAERAAAEAAARSGPRALANRCKDPLAPADLRRVREATRAADRAVVVDHFNYEVCGEHAQRLAPGQWLVDELVNYYFAMLQQRDAELCAAEPGRAPSHFFNSFFIPKLMGTDARTYNYAGVRRWTKKFDLFSRHRVFAPVNVGNMHWCLIGVDFRARAIRYYDSMGGTGAPYLKAMLKYLKDEHQTKKGGPLPVRRPAPPFLPPVPAARARARRATGRSRAGGPTRRSSTTAPTAASSRPSAPTTRRSARPSTSTRVTSPTSATA